MTCTGTLWQVFIWVFRLEIQSVIPQTNSTLSFQLINPYFRRYRLVFRDHPCGRTGGAANRPSGANLQLLSPLQRLLLAASLPGRAQDGDAEPRVSRDGQRSGGRGGRFALSAAAIAGQGGLAGRGGQCEREVALQEGGGGQVWKFEAVSWCKQKNGGRMNIEENPGPILPSSKIQGPSCRPPKIPGPTFGTGEIYKKVLCVCQSAVSISCHSITHNGGWPMDFSLYILPLWKNSFSFFQYTVCSLILFAAALP